MPPSRTQSKLVAKYGERGRQAVQNHAGDATDYGFIRLPGGINNGVARIARVYFDEYKKQYLPGEMFMRAVGVVVSPETVEVDGQDVPVRGLQTSIMIPVCDVPGTGTRAGVSMDENIAQIMNEYRKLGFDTTNSSLETLEDDAALIQESAPYFRFSTSWGKDRVTGKEDRSKVWENWYGSKGLETYVDPGDGGVEDNTAQTPPKAAAAPTRNGTHTAAKANPAPVRAMVTVPEPQYRDDQDVDSLAARADAGDDEAIRDLTAMAESVLLDPAALKKFHDAPTYAAGVKLMKSPAAQPAKAATAGKKGPAPKPIPAPEPEPADDEWAGPNEGELYDVRIGKAVIEGLVKAVDPDARTMDVMNTKTKKIVSGVSWDAIATGE